MRPTASSSAHAPKDPESSKHSRHPKPGHRPHRLTAPGRAAALLGTAVVAGAVAVGAAAVGVATPTLAADQTGAVTRAASASPKPHSKADPSKAKAGLKPVIIRTRGGRTPGIDVASHQGNVDWKHWWSKGKKFAYVKATEGTRYRNPYFRQQYFGAGDVGMIRGAYHFGRPDRASGADQANFFVDNGGGLRSDGRTLPGELDIEYGEAVSVSTCYGISKRAMVNWIRDFLQTYKARTGHNALIYTTEEWWQQCTGDTKEFSDSPLWIAEYGRSTGPLPGRWKRHTFWQYTDSPIDQNYFNGSLDELKAWAYNAAK
ncbi:lysozyme [Actinopolymorpha alba]|uniref:lysozyme n=1 Tax=Actinopolymorpha alba TaxID=533267 RepID=UPI00039C3CD1|nr:lysozyme [Actinopolymorpha alba]